MGLTGKGVLVGIVDSGIDYFHQDFRNADGTTRILALWDQSLERIFTEEEINEALFAADQGGREAGLALVPSRDVSGHGTAVAGIAAGNGRESQGRYRGVAYESPLLVVKLGTADPNGFPRTTQLMRAVNFVLQEAVRLGMPIAVNLSLEIPMAPTTEPVFWKPFWTAPPITEGMLLWPVRAMKGGAGDILRGSFRKGR